MRSDPAPYADVVPILLDRTAGVLLQPIPTPT